MDSPQSGIKALRDEWSEAVRRKDIQPTKIFTHA
jgi:hypothetical protein